MGRKKIPNNARKQVMTCSLKPKTIERIDEAISYKTNRSKWIESAIEMKLDGVEFENPQSFSNTRLLSMIHGRFTAKIDAHNPLWNMEKDLQFMLEQILILQQTYLELKA